MHTVPGAFQRLQELYAEGESLIASGLLEQAVERFTEGLGIDDHFRQRYVTMYAQRAFAQQRLGRYGEAIEDYTRAIEMEPPINQAQYHFHRGMCFAAAIDGAERAVADYTRAIELYPDHPGPYHLRGKLLADKLGRYPEAIADFDRMLRMRPNPDAFMWRGIAKYELGHHADARVDFEASNTLAENAHNHYMLACIAARTKDEALLFRSMAATLATDPSYGVAFHEDAEFEPYRGDPRFSAGT